MKTLKKWLAGLTAGVVLASGVAMSGAGAWSEIFSGVENLTASAEEITVPVGTSTTTLTYDYLSDGTINITDCDTSATGDLEIPSEIDGVAVTSIVSYAFYSCDALTSITIPDSVTSIGKDAFYGTGILNNQDGPVYYADTWVIDCDTDVTSVEIKDGTKGIADYAFYNCDSLTSITIPNSALNSHREARSKCKQADITKRKQRCFSK